MSRNNANLVCGMPLPRAWGKYRNRRYPVARAPPVGIKTRRHGELPAGYMRAASLPVRRINATTTKPTITPRIRLRAIVIWSSRLRNRSSNARTLGPWDSPRGDFLLTVSG